MKYCPRCQRTYPRSQRFCSGDGELLSLKDPYNLTGRIIADKYRIDALVGVGGMGAVYRAHQIAIGRHVAFKILLPHFALNNKHIITLFEREAQIVGKFNHPNVAAVYDAGRSDDILYMVMEWLEGATLEDKLAEHGSFSLAQTADYLRQIAAALNEAHARQIIHRDLKPSNLMLITRPDGTEQVKVLDFGIAKVVSETVTAALGTPHYASPEQVQPGSHIDGRSDIYSLGVMLYQMLTGSLPFNAESIPELMRLHLEASPPSIRQHRPEVPEAIERLINRMLAKSPEQRPQRAGEITEFFDLAINAEPKPPATGMRVALLYRRNAQPDEQVLKLLEKELGQQGCQVFVDRHLTIGVEWAKEIERQVRTADAVIPLLSAASVQSEMLAYEVQIAHEAAGGQGKPRLLPVRISYDGTLPEPLAGILNPIQHALWNGPQDDERLVADLLKGMTTTAVAEPKKLEPVGGAVPLDSEFYIVRPADEDFCTAITRQDSIVLVKGARQMGKTSLLARGLQQARQTGARVVHTDFQLLNTTHLSSVDALFRALAESIADELDLDILPDQLWNPGLGASMNFRRFIKREVLGKITAPLVWGLDEVDRLFTCDFGSEVFGLFRSWHNARSLDPNGPWQRLTLAIAYATEAHLFITDVNQSPFNVGTRLTLEDFTVEQVAELNRRYGSPLRDQSEVARYYNLVSGHPYLVRRGLHEMVTHGTDLTTFESQADRDEGSFGDHLRRILVLLAQDTALCNIVRGILEGRPCQTAESFYRLRSAGVMAGDSANEVKPRCQLYATYLKRHLL